jgi:hypothetical protein
MKICKICICTALLSMPVSALSTWAEESSNSILHPLTEEQEKTKAAGEALARKIMSGAPRFSIIGQLDQDAGGTFRINGESVRINKETRIEGELAVGVSVSAHGFIENGVRIARVVQVSSGAPAETNAVPSSASAMVDFSPQKK